MVNENHLLNPVQRILVSLINILILSGSILLFIHCSNLWKASIIIHNEFYSWAYQALAVIFFFAAMILALVFTVILRRLIINK
jgi:hypothetical protein